MTIDRVTEPARKLRHFSHMRSLDVGHRDPRDALGKHLRRKIWILAALTSNEIDLRMKRQFPSDSGAVAFF